MSAQFAPDAARRAWIRAWWVLPAIALGVLIGWEIDWGRHLFPVPPVPTPVAPAPVGAAVLPEYRIDGGLAARSETGSRTLFNPTRRSAPTLASEGGGPGRIHAGQYVLVGTAVSGDVKMAFLKEAAGGKGRVVRQGDEINGVKVALVAADRVKLTAGGDAEELLLKVVKGPKTTVGAAPPAPGAAVPPTGQPLPAAQAAPTQAAPARPAGTQGPTETAATARSARRTMGAPPQAPQGGAAAPAGAGGGPPPAAAPGTWAATFQNMQQQQQQQQR